MLCTCLRLPKGCVACVRSEWQSRLGWGLARRREHCQKKKAVIDLLQSVQKIKSGSNATPARGPLLRFQQIRFPIVSPIRAVGF